MVKNKSVNLTHKLFEELLGGGGTRDGAREVVRGAYLAAKQLGSQAARSLEVDNSVSRWGDKSETAVGRICQSDNKIKTLYNTS